LAVSPASLHKLPAAASSQTESSFARNYLLDRPPLSLWHLLLYFSIIIPVAVLAVGCQKKPTPLTAIQIRAITREFVLAARNASNGRVETGMFPEVIPGSASVPPRGPGQAPRDQPPAPPADLIFITLPHTEGGQTDAASLAAIIDELNRVAQVHNLKGIQRTSVTGIIRYEYFYAGQRTHAVNIVTPSVKSELPPPGAARPRLAIIIDDLGYDRDLAESIFQLPYPLTLSVLPHLPHSTEIAEEAFRRGYQVMLHLPMEAKSDEKAEMIELHPGMDPGEVTRVMQGMLATVPQALGVNNHQGSLSTSDPALMNAMMPALRERDLYFVDSRTAPTSVAFDAARRARVPTAIRDVFLDDAGDSISMRQRLDQAVRDARLHGEAVAIGHPRPSTVAALAEYLPQVEREGVALVFASQVVH